MVIQSTPHENGLMEHKFIIQGGQNTESSQTFQLDQKLSRAKTGIEMPSHRHCIIRLNFQSISSQIVEILKQKPGTAAPQPQFS
jgi:hypothetical protein